MEKLEDLWFGNYQPNLYEPDDEEKMMTDRLELVSLLVRETHPDDAKIDELIDACSRLMVKQSGRAFKAGVKFGFSFAKEIEK